MYFRGKSEFIAVLKHLKRGKMCETHPGKVDLEEKFIAPGIHRQEVQYLPTSWRPEKYIGIQS